MATEQGRINLQLNTQSAIDIMLEPVFVDGLITDSFALVKNLYAGEYKIGLLEAMKNVSGKAQACSPKYKGIAAMSERVLTANYAEAGVVFCYEEFERTQYDWLAPFQSTSNGMQNATQLISLLTRLLGDAIRRDVERVAWFGDSASINENLNFADGVFKYLSQIITTGEIGYRVNSTQGTLLTNEQAYDLLFNVIDNAKPELKQIPRAERVIHINGILWDKIIQHLRESSINNGFIKVFEDPMNESVATVNGIKVLAHYNWDSISEEYFGLVNQNKIIYTTKSNLVMGTDLRPDALGGKSFFKAYQDPKNDEITLSSKYILAVNYVFASLFSVAL